MPVSQKGGRGCYQSKIIAFHCFIVLPAINQSLLVDVGTCDKQSVYSFAIHVWSLKLTVYSPDLLVKYI